MGEDEQKEWDRVIEAVGKLIGLAVAIGFIAWLIGFINEVSL